MKMFNRFFQFVFFAYVPLAAPSISMITFFGLELGYMYKMKFPWIQFFIPILPRLNERHVNIVFALSQKYPTRQHKLSFKSRHIRSKQPDNYNYHNKLKDFSQKWEASETHELKFHDRFGQSTKVDYGDSHPFEIMERRRNLSAQQKEDIRQLQPNPWRDGAEYKPIRIILDTEFLNLVSVENADKIEFLKNEVLPPVFDFWSNALRVFPLQGNLVVNKDFCPYSDVLQTQQGVANADLLVLLAADVKAICDEGSLAAARSCQADQFDRPIVGTAVICLSKLDLTDVSSKDDYISVLIHEIAHVLGMRAIDFAYYYDSTTGLPRTPRPFLTQQASCVDGAISEVILPSQDTIQQGRTKAGDIYYEIVTPTVKSIARNQFDCQSMTGARLENQPTNSGNCFGTHWEARLFASDLLSAIALQTKQFVTPMTLALFEDSGWYKPDYSLSRISPFGHQRGCDFVYDDCIDENGNVPEWGKGFFCNEKLGTDSSLQCDSSRNFISRCDLVDFDDYPHGVSPAVQYQYFKDHPSWGGLLHTAAYCPMPSITVTGTNADGIFEFDCRDSDLESTVTAEYFGDDSKCIDTNAGRPMCMKTSCDKANHKVNIIVDGQVIICEKDGDWKKISNKISFQCPPIAVVCPDLGCPYNCAGRGVCDQSQTPPVCVCCDKDDNSSSCENSPVGCEKQLNNHPITLLPTSAPSSWYLTPKPTNFATEIAYLLTTTTQSPTSSPQRQISSSPSVKIDSVYIPEETGTITEVQSDDFFYPTEEIKEIDNTPSAFPSNLPRDETELLYTFCVDHSILLPIDEVLKQSSQSISNTLNSLFQDDVQIMKNKWNIDEQHLYVVNIHSVWLENPPARYECECVDEDNDSVCSAFESTVEVSHWEKIDKSDVRYLLLYFAPYVSRNLPYTSKYLGFEAVTTTSAMRMHGLPPFNEISPETKKTLENTLMNVLKENKSKDLQTLDILSLNIIDITPIKPDKKINDRRDLSEETGASEVKFTVTGEYIPPPYVNLKEVVHEVIEENGSEIVEELKSSNDPFFSKLEAITDTQDSTLSPTISPTTDIIGEPSKKEEGSSSKVGLALGIIVGILGALAAGYAGYIYVKKERENAIDTEFDPQNYPYFRKSSILDMDTVGEESTITTFLNSRKEYSTREHFHDMDDSYDGFSDEGSYHRSRRSARSFGTNSRSSIGESVNTGFHSSGNHSYRHKQSLTSSLGSSMGESVNTGFHLSGKHSYRHKQSLTSSLGSSCGDSYTSGPSQTYSYYSGSHETVSDDEESYVSGRSGKNSFLPERHIDRESSKFGDPPSDSTNFPSIDPPEELIDESEDDAGTYAGRLVNVNTDDSVSTLHLFRAVEDTWLEQQEDDEAREEGETEEESEEESEKETYHDTTDDESGIESASMSIREYEEEDGLNDGNNAMILHQAIPLPTRNDDEPVKGTFDDCDCEITPNDNENETHNTELVVSTQNCHGRFHTSKNNPEFQKESAEDENCRVHQDDINNNNNNDNNNTLVLSSCSQFKDKYGKRKFKRQSELCSIEEESFTFEDDDDGSDCQTDIEDSSYEYHATKTKNDLIVTPTIGINDQTSFTQEQQEGKKQTEDNPTNKDPDATYIDDDYDGLSYNPFDCNDNDTIERSLHSTDDTLDRSVVSIDETIDRSVLSIDD